MAYRFLSVSLFHRFRDGSVREALIFSVKRRKKGAGLRLRPDDTPVTIGSRDTVRSETSADDNFKTNLIQHEFHSFPFVFFVS